VNSKLPDTPAVGDQPFGEFYYRNCCGRPYLRNEEWLTFFGEIADHIVTDLQPKHVLDAGCALGLLVEQLRRRGVDACGIDISSYAIAHADDSVKPYCQQGSIADPFGEQYDLIVSIEVLEHMGTADAERAIRNFCAHTDRVLFSSSPVDYREPTHVNVHPVDYWAEQFARFGFYRDVDFDASFLTPWAVLFRRSADPIHRIIRSYERRFHELQSGEEGARSYSVELEQRLARTEAELAARDRTIRDLQGDVTRLREHLQVGRDTIANMKRSAFWRMRERCIRIKRVFRPDAS
jgi:SAM-dependent methyltransferase